MHLVTQLMGSVQLIPSREEKLRLKLLESFQESQSMNLCKLVLKQLMPQFQQAEVRESSLLVIDKLERQLLLSMLLSIKERTIRTLMRKRNFIVSTLLSDRRDQLLLILLRISKKMELWTIQSLSQPQLVKLLHFNSQLLIQAVPSENISETLVDMLLLFMMTCQSKLLLIDKCLYCLEDLQVEKPSQVMYFTYIPDFSRELPK